MEQLRENKMGVMPINKLLISMSVPMMISMLVQALYNIVDSIFVAQYSENGLNAVSLAFPIQQLMIAVAVGTGVGINAMVSRRLGEKKFEDANLVAMNGIFLSVIASIAFALFGIFGAIPFMKLFSDNTEIISMGSDYISICTIFSFGVFLQVTFERLLQSTGNTIYNMYIQGSGAIINIILDPILIFGLFGFPELGIAGAALATVIGQIFGMLLGLYLNMTKNKELQLRLKGFRPNARAIGQIYKIGVPSIVMQSIGAILTFSMNKILISFSDVAVSVFGIYYKLQSFIFMPVFGITNGLIPIVAYNYGAGNRKRITGTIKIAIKLVSAIMALGVIVFWIFPEQLLLLFKASDEMIEIGVRALRYISLSFMLAGVAIVFSAVFQALGNGVYSLLMSSFRQLICILPIAYVLAHYVGFETIWFSFAIAEALAFILAAALYKRIYHNKIKVLGSMDK